MTKKSAEVDRAKAETSEVRPMEEEEEEKEERVAGSNSDFSDLEEHAVDCRYQLGQLIEKVSAVSLASHFCNHFLSSSTGKNIINVHFTHSCLSPLSYIYI